MLFAFYTSWKWVMFVGSEVGGDLHLLTTFSFPGLTLLEWVVTLFRAEFISSGGGSMQNSTDWVNLWFIHLLFRGIESCMLSWATERAALSLTLFLQNVHFQKRGVEHTKKNPTFFFFAMHRKLAYLSLHLGWQILEAHPFLFAVNWVTYIDQLTELFHLEPRCPDL